MSSQSQGKYEMTGKSLGSDESSQSQEICKLTGKIPRSLYFDWGVNKL